jgi:hypothetical protein
VSGGERVDGVADEHEAFLRYLQEISETVKSWPYWKRTILSGGRQLACMRPICPLESLSHESTGGEGRAGAVYCHMSIRQRACFNYSPPAVPRSAAAAAGSF